MVGGDDDFNGDGEIILTYLGSSMC